MKQFPPKKKDLISLLIGVSIVFLFIPQTLNLFVPVYLGCATQRQHIVASFKNSISAF